MKFKTKTLVRNLIVIAFPFFLPAFCLSQANVAVVDKNIRKSDFISAGRKLKALYANDTAKEEYYYYMGEINRCLGNYTAAKAYYNKVLAMHPNSAKTTNSLGIVAIVTGDTDESIRLFKQAISLDSTNSDYYNSLGGYYFTTEQYYEALPYYLKAYKMNPNSKTVLYNLGITYANLDTDQLAIVYLTKSLKQCKHQLTYQARANAYYRLKDYKKSIKDYTSALKMKDSDNPYETVDRGFLFYYRGFAWKNLGNEKKYERDIQQAKDHGYTDDDN